MIGDRIKSYRTSLGMTQAELAQKCDVKPTVVSSWEINRTEPNLGQCVSLANAFGMSIDELVNGAEPDAGGIRIHFEDETYYPFKNSAERLLHYAMIVSKMKDSQQEEVFNYIDYISKKG